MNFLTFFRNLLRYFLKKKLVNQPKISLLIPFSSKDRIRKRNFKWLLEYWRNELPEAEILIGRSKGKVFCKGEALNDAAQRSRGKVLVVLDADAYLPGSIINQCADNILDSLKRGHPLWYVPYRQLYRLKREITDDVINSDPRFPLRFTDPIDKSYVIDQGESSRYGHRFGAMITIFPIEGYDAIKCFDERFVGWGGEDIAFLRAMDTMFGKHKTTKTSVYHLWHPFIGETHPKRMWDKQSAPNSNGKLTLRYHHANRNWVKMNQIINEAYNFYKRQKM
jgi:glycosyltransferase involved in cell wall biosynthesis